MKVDVFPAARYVPFPQLAMVGRGELLFVHRPEEEALGFDLR
jgi:hypothetical protein